MSTGSSPVVEQADAALRRLGFEPFAYQRRTWQRQAAGGSGLILVPTGSGKTLAAMAATMVMLSGERRREPDGGHRLGCLYISPLRAVARDITRALAELNERAGLGLSVEMRSGDTSSYRKKRQLSRMPDVLVSTPESLALLISQAGAADRFAHLRCLVLDEWHELLGSKRGVLLQLGREHLRGICGTLQIWALSATLADEHEALAGAVGPGTDAVVIRAELSREVHLEPLIPERLDAFPWGGHLGLVMRRALAQRLQAERSTLIFTNTRNQAERWYTALLEERPEMEGRVALHHGSIDGGIRSAVEEGLREGRLRWVVATSSLDLGIDFRPVEEVVQIGSAKGVARLLQRAGRSGHRPGELSRIVLVPTNALELVEMLALERARRAGRLEPRPTPRHALDVLLQHLLNLAAGDGLEAASAFNEARATLAYRDLDHELYRELVDFLQSGGRSLSAYEQYRKLAPAPPSTAEGDRRLVFRDERLRRVHRMNIGTITSNPHLRVAFKNGTVLGEVEEGFVSRLRKGDVFFFGGHRLEYVMLQQETLRVRRARGARAVAPSWPGGRLPISETLGDELRAILDELRDGAAAEDGDNGEDGDSDWTAAVRAALAPIRRAQLLQSALPAAGELLCEVLTYRGAGYLFIYPFQGSHVHQGIAAVIATRLARRRSGTYLTSVNEYGLLVQSGDGGDALAGLIAESAADLFSTAGLEADLEASLNLSDMARVEFREIAQITGLVLRRMPGHEARLRQIQASSNLLFDVFREFDPEHPLYREAFRAVLARQLDYERLVRTLERMAGARLVIARPGHPTPLGFPLFAGSVANQVSNEDHEERIRRLIAGWERDG